MTSTASDGERPSRSLDQTMPDDDVLRAFANRLHERRLLAWTEQLHAWWRHFNDEYLDDALRPPVIRVAHELDRTLGQWHPGTRTLAIAASHLERDGWLDVLETLRHEMAHQLVDEVLGGAGDEPPHGPTFRSACAKLNVDSAATRAVDRDGPPAAADTEHARLVRRIDKLLQLGASPNEHEAAAALRKARQLLVDHQLDALAVEGDREFARLELGPLRARHHAWEYALGSILEDFFFVRVIWTPSFDAAELREGTVLLAYGARANLELAEYVHGWITGALDRLWATYRRARGIRGHRERLRFCAGVLGGFREQLAAQADALPAATTAVVAAGDPVLDAFVRRHNPRTRRVSWGGNAATEVYEEGRNMGRELRLRRPLRNESSAPPRQALPDREA